MIDEPTGAWVAAAIEGVDVTSLSDTAVPDLILTHGATVEGQVFDEVTGDPLAGVSIGSYGPHRPRSSAAIIGTRTDANGHYRLRVAPGKSYVYVSGPPPGYGSPGSAIGSDIEVLPGQTETLDFTVGPERQQQRGWWPF
jgi:hypothetical protein